MLCLCRNAKCDSNFANFGNGKIMPDFATFSFKHLSSLCNDPCCCFYYIRLASLQVNGEEGWKRRVGEKDHGSFRSGTIHDRLSKIKDSSEGWQKKKGQENDAKQFTVEGKMASKLTAKSFIHTM